MGGRISIQPSILSADFSRMGEEISLVERAGADVIHLDVMDGHFVPNISFGPPVIRSLRKTTDMPFWAHLMISEPGKYLEAFAGTGVQGLTIHCEIEEDWVGLIDAIHSFGIGAGVAVNPDTPVERITGVVDRLDRVLIMTVHPGFGGQSFMPGPVEKIARLKEIADRMDSPLEIAVDGGIDAETAPGVVRAGARSLIAGSAIYHADDPVEALAKIRRAAEDALDGRDA